jgi:hypothetical protein
MLVSLAPAPLPPLLGLAEDAPKLLLQHASCDQTFTDRARTSCRCTYCCCERYRPPACWLLYSLPSSLWRQQEASAHDVTDTQQQRSAEGRTGAGSLTSSSPTSACRRHQTKRSSSFSKIARLACVQCSDSRDVFVSQIVFRRRRSRSSRVRRRSHALATMGIGSSSSTPVVPASPGPAASANHELSDGPSSACCCGITTLCGCQAALCNHVPSENRIPPRLLNDAEVKRVVKRWLLTPTELDYFYQRVAP